MVGFDISLMGVSAGCTSEIDPTPVCVLSGCFGNRASSWGKAGFEVL